MCSFTPGRSFDYLIRYCKGLYLILGPRIDSVEASIPLLLCAWPGLAPRDEARLWSFALSRVSPSLLLDACSDSCCPIRVLHKLGGPHPPEQSF
jgi:hypothetical protein